jgi:hypothetical protein
MTTAAPTLDLSNLPMAATLDITKPVAQVRDAWRETITYLDQLRSQPGVAYSTLLGVKLDSVRYDAALALETITRWEGGGGTGAETATTISGLAAPTDAFKNELAAAKIAWASEFGGAGAATRPSLWAQVTAPRDNSWYLLWGGAALALYLLTMKR